MLSSSKLVGCMLYSLLILHFKNIEVAAAEPVMHFECDDNGIKSIDQVQLKNVYILMNESAHTYCRPNNPNLTNCFDTSKINVTGKEQRQELKVIYEDETKPHIIGGKQVYHFLLKCTKKAVLLNASASFSQMQYNDTYTKQIQNIELKGNLTLTISGKTDNSQQIQNVKVGQSLDLLLKGPDGYVMSPQECTAKPSDPQYTEKVKLWTATRNDSSCNDYDSDLIDQKWKEKKDHLSIGMYAFRFDSSDEVTITCTAFVCPSADESSSCSRVCATPLQESKSRRRRYAIVDRQRIANSASVSFRVVPKDKQNIAADLSPTPVAFVFLLFAVIKWKCMEF